MSRQRSCNTSTFAHANGAAEGGQLAVDVGFGNVIEVDQGECANAATRQGFHCPRTYATHANDANMRSGEAVKCRFTVSADDAAKPTANIHLIHYAA